MIGTAIRVAWALTRLDTCVLVFSSVFLPVLYHSHDLYFSLSHSAPILAICMCGFVINDLSDIERDRENHPERPLPNNLVSEVAASVVYFCLLTISLLSIKIYVDQSNVYLYVLLLVCLINYNYVVSYIPVLKNVYVALTGLIPIFILSSLINGGSNIYEIALSLFLFLLARELLMDVQDSSGDDRTAANILGLKSAENIAFVLKVLASASLFLAVRDAFDVILTAFVLLLDIAFIVLWRNSAYRRAIIHLMKVQLVVGIYFLVANAETLRSS